ncbi:NAD/NADP octopine/nopaline dehydrogenase family protein [Paraburkholderia mimosarum]|uniref:NAD/NADP octopine/nopaline dehydrogenase family protein n=2 Tax=Paraburkholderia mimosarum TaxID=312026 RepID=UPI0039C3A499
MKDGKVLITGIKSSLPIAAFPNSPAQTEVSLIADTFPQPLIWCGNIFEIGMQSNNGVIHPVSTILNTGWIESTSGEFLFYRDGMTPSVGRVIEEVDRERLQIAEALGFRLQTVLEEMANFYGGSYGNFSEFAFQTKVHNATKITPAHMQDRYLSEDIPYILVPWYALGEKVGVDAPTIKATVEIASVINGINYFEQGRNSNRLGVDRMTKAELLLFASRTTTKVNL